MTTATREPKVVNLFEGMSPKEVEAALDKAARKILKAERDAKRTYYIVYRYQYHSKREIIDQFVGKVYANEMLAEYRMAYGACLELYKTSIPNAKLLKEWSER